MFERLFPRKKRDPKPLPQPDSQLALGALLIRVALADRQYKLAEVAAIDRILQATFGIGPLEAAKLRAVCTDLEMHAADKAEFAKILRDEVDYAERMGLAHAMWQVVMADGESHSLEEGAVEEIETALGLSEEDCAAARAAALGAGG